MPRRDFEQAEEFEEKVVSIARTAKVVKGGRRFGFRAVVVVGDKQGKVGVGVGKAGDVPEAIRKGGERARRNMQPVILDGTTIPHPILATFVGAKVLLKPASPRYRSDRRRWRARRGGSGWCPRYPDQVIGQREYS